jgi:LacI family gluconate utilization system Gnt-I transcriptional repressor
VQAQLEKMAEVADPGRIEDGSRRGMARARMSDVARLAEVSSSTVSRALRTPEVVSPEVRLRIDDAMRRLSYVPNMMAGTLAAARSRVVGMVIPSIRNSAFATMVEEVTERLSAEGYQMLIGHSNYSLEEEEKLVTSFLSWSPAGIILTGRQHGRGTIGKLMAADIPVVEAWEAGEPTIDSIVGFSHREAGQKVARYFLGQGLTRLATIVAAPHLDLRAAQRSAGFRDHLREMRGIDPVDIALPDRPSAQGGGEGLAAALAADPGLQAVFFSNDMVAMGGLFECQRRGIAVPGDLRICGFGDLSFTASTVPPLSTIRPPRTEIGTRSAEILLGRIRGELEPGQQVNELGVEHIVRGSG